MCCHWNRWFLGRTQPKIWGFTSHVWHVGLSLSIGASIYGHASNEKSCFLKHEISTGIAISMGKTMLWAIGFYHWIFGSFHDMVVICGDHPHVQYPRIGGMEHLQASLYFWFQKTCSCRLRVSWFFFNRNHFEWEKPAFFRGGTFNCQVKVCSVRNGCGSCCGAYRDYPLVNVYHSNYTQVLWRQHEISVVKPIFFSSNYHPCLVTLGMIYDDLWWSMAPLWNLSLKRYSHVMHVVPGTHVDIGHPITGRIIMVRNDSDWFERFRL